MTEETNGAVPTDAEDTAAVLSIASGEKTYLGQQDAPEATTSEQPPGEDDAAAQPETEAQAEQPKPKKTARERIDELTWQKRELERQYQSLLDRVSGKQAPAQEAHPQPADGRPDPQSYEYGVNDPRYVEDLTDWKAEQAVTRHLTAREQAQTVESKLTTFAQKAAELYPDGDPEGLQAFRALPAIPPGITEVILASDVGPKIAEHLGDNPREFQRLSGLSPALQARELTLLEARLKTPAEAPKPAPKTATDAPEPPPQTRGAGGRFQVAADTNDFAAFEKQYLGPGR